MEYRSNGVLGNKGVWQQVEFTLYHTPLLHPSNTPLSL